MNKFKIGDIITGIRGHMEDYTYTTSEAKMLVIDVYREDSEIQVEILEHTRYPRENGRIFNVESEYFKLCKPIMLENK